MPDHSLRVGIDASNIHRGGGITHLIQLLQAAEPRELGIEEVVVWSRSIVLSRLPERPWLRKVHVADLDGALPRRLAWQRFRLPVALRRERCDVLFSPGGLVPPRAGKPAVTMSRNLLPFEPEEAARYGRFSALRLKMRLLRYGQAASMRRADGVIFLSDYARARVSEAIGRSLHDTRTIPHGLGDRFFLPPRPAVAEDELSAERPFRLLYVSTVDMYKHQWEVVRAAGQLRAAGLPVRLDLIGSPVPDAKAKLDQAIAEVDPAGAFVTYHDAVAFEALHRYYQEADAFVFASSCENLPNILLEAMATGLPIACSRMGPMPEVLGDAGAYFDPLDSRTIADAIRTLIDDSAGRERLARRAFDRAKGYSWTRCAADTFTFVAEVARSRTRRAA